MRDSGFVDLDTGMLLAGTDRVDHIEVKVANIYDAPRIADQIADAVRQGLRHAGLDRHQPAALLGAAAREDRHGHRHRPDRRGRRAQHRRVADPAGDGEDARHRDPEDDGRLGEEHHADLPAAGHDHRRDRHDRRRDRRRADRAFARSLSPDHDSERHLPGELPAVQADAGRSRRRDHRRRGRVLRRPRSIRRDRRRGSIRRRR